MFVTKMRTISSFLKTNYSDESLDKFLQAAMDGHVIYRDARCCLVGRSDVDKRHKFCAAKSAPAQALLYWEVSIGRNLTNKLLVFLAKREIKRRAKESSARMAEGRKLTEDLLCSAMLDKSNPEVLRNVEIHSTQ